MSAPVLPAPVTRDLRSLALLVGLIVAAQLGGAFGTTDEWLLGQIARLAPAPPRNSVPVVLELDARSLARFGPLPWSGATWAAVSAQLGAAGVDEAWLVDPWPRVLAEDDEGDEMPAGGAVLRVPTLELPSPWLVGGRDALAPPAGVGPVRAAQVTLALPLRGGGVLRDLGAEAGRGGPGGPSAYCSWLGACPDGAPMGLAIAAPRRRSSLATLSLVDALDAATVGGLEELKDRLILVGTTDLAMAGVVRVGAEALPMSRADAIAWLVATGRSRAPVPRGGMGIQVLAILAVFGLALLARRAVRVLRSEMEFVVVVGTAGVAAVALTLAGLFAPPPTALLLAAGAPGLASVFTSRMRTLVTLRRMAFVLLHDSLQAGWRESMVREPRDLLLTLASLSRTHFPGHAVACFHRPGAGPELELLGTFGGGDHVLVDPHPRLDRPPFDRAAPLDQGGDSAGLFAGEQGEGRLLPLRTGRELAGFWCVIAPPGAAPADPLVLRRLARWAERHLELPRPRGFGRLRARLADRIESETAEVERVFKTVTEERRRQAQTLAGIDLPLFGCDLAGAVVFVNRAQAAVFDEMELPSPRSVRGLLSRLVRESELDGIAQHVAARGQTLRRTGISAAGQPWELLLQPLRTGSDGGEDDFSVPGFVGSLRPRIQEVRLGAMREAIVRFSSSRVRNSLTVIHGYAHLLGDVLEAPEHLELQQAILRHTDEIRGELEAFGAVLVLDTASELHVTVDAVRIAEQMLEELRPAAGARGVEIEFSSPEFSLPVIGDPRRTGDALRILLGTAVRGAYPGSAVHVGIEQEHDQSKVSIVWRGPGFDSRLVEEFNGASHRSPEALPSAVRELGAARKTFRDLHLISEPGHGGTFAFTLHRSGGAGRPA